MIDQPSHQVLADMSSNMNGLHHVNVMTRWVKFAPLSEKFERVWVYVWVCVFGVMCVSVCLGACLGVCLGVYGYRCIRE